jgi:hypothetical protein
MQVKFCVEIDCKHKYLYDYLFLCTNHRHVGAVNHRCYRIKLQVLQICTSENCDHMQITGT